MHYNEELLTKLFQCLNAHDHGGMADCYGEEAAFQDIAFTLHVIIPFKLIWSRSFPRNASLGRPEWAGNFPYDRTIIPLPAIQGQGNRGQIACFSEFRTDDADYYTITKTPAEAGWCSAQWISIERKWN